MYSPLAEKYLSLYPKNKEQKLKQKADMRNGTEKPEMWFIIERAMSDGTLDAIRNWRRPLSRRKLSPCQKYLDGNCERGVSCSYSHDLPSKVTDSSSALELMSRFAKTSIPEDKDDVKRKGESAEIQKLVEPKDEREDEDVSDGGFFEE